MNSPSQEFKVKTNRCPKCDADIRADSSVLFGDMPCPTCGVKLFYIVAADSARFFDHESSKEMQNKAISFIADRMELNADELAANPSMLNEQDTDSLEALELLMDLEEELGLV